MKAKEILPCPFDGHSPDLVYDAGNEVWGQSWQVECPHCGARSKKFFGSSTWSVVKQQDKQAEADAIVWWNRRPCAASQAAEERK